MSKPKISIWQDRSGEFPVFCGQINAVLDGGRLFAESSVVPAVLGARETGRRESKGWIPLKGK